MNDVRRKEINKAIDLIREAQSILESCRDDEQDYLDNIPENLQSSDRYYRAEEAIDSLDEAIDSLDSAADQAEEAVE